MSGTIPRELADMERIQAILLSNNNLSGTIPSDLRMLRMTLRSIFLDSNRLTGTIPASWDDMSVLQNVWFHNNTLQGSIPMSWTSYSNLLNVRLNDNSLTGTVPSFFFNETMMYNMRELTLSRNHFIGTIPNNFTIQYMTVLSLDENSLTGTIPSTIGLLSFLDILRLNDNSLSGSIPTELSSLLVYGYRPREIYLHNNNQLVGNLTHIFCKNNNNDDIYSAPSSNGWIISADCPNEEFSNTNNTNNNITNEMEASINSFIECSCCTTCCNPTVGCLDQMV